MPAQPRPLGFPIANPICRPPFPHSPSARRTGFWQPNSLQPFTLPHLLPSTHLHPCPQRVFQLGVGGGMKGGCNVWRALRHVDGSKHRAWAHLEGKPLTEADLPRGIDKDVVRWAISELWISVGKLRERARGLTAAGCDWQGHGQAWSGCPEGPCVACFWVWPPALQLGGCCACNQRPHARRTLDARWDGSAGTHALGCR